MAVNYIDMLFYMVFPIIGLVCTITLPWLPLLMWKRLVPEPARKLCAARRQGSIPCFVTHDSGRTKLILITERRGGGIVYTDDGKYKILPRLIGREEDSSKNPMTDGRKTLIRDWGDFFTKRSNLIGLDKPIFFGYSGKACLLNPEALALYQAGLMQIKSENGMMKFKPTDATGLTVGELADTDSQELLQPLLILDARECKNMVSESYDDTQLAAVVEDARMAGAMGTMGLGKYKNLIIVIVVIGLIVLGALVLPQVLQGVAK